MDEIKEIVEATKHFDSSKEMRVFSELEIVWRDTTLASMKKTEEREELNRLWKEVQKAIYG